MFNKFLQEFYDFHYFRDSQLEFNIFKSRFEKITTLRSFFERNIGEVKSTIAFGRQEPAALHQPQVLRRHVTRDFARLRKLTHRVLPVQQHLDHPQSVGVRERPKAFCGLSQGLEIDQL